MKKKFDWLAINPNEKKALLAAVRLKAYRVRGCKESEVDFADVWRHVQHEVDLYDKGQDCNVLKKDQAEKARSWLEEYKYLYRMSKERKTVNQINREKHEAWIRRYQANGGAIAEYVCPACGADLITMLPESDGLTWYTFSTCFECNWLHLLTANHSGVEVQLTDLKQFSDDNEESPSS